MMFFREYLIVLRLVNEVVWNMYFLWDVMVNSFVGFMFDFMLIEIMVILVCFIFFVMVCVEEG